MTLTVTPHAKKSKTHRAEKPSFFYRLHRSTSLFTQSLSLSLSLSLCTFVHTFVIIFCPSSYVIRSPRMPRSSILLHHALLSDIELSLSLSLSGRFSYSTI